MQKRIGFISTRFHGTDGVSLEASKWSHVFEQSGHLCFWFAGELDRPKSRSFRVNEAHFQHPTNVRINRHVLGQSYRTPRTTELIHAQSAYLKQQIHRFIKAFQLDLLIAENILSLPMHIPLGLALTETLAEARIAVIAHHHDFYWERSRYAVNAVPDYLNMAFPPCMPQVAHAVINSTARQEMALRTGIAAYQVPNVMDFDNPIPVRPERCLAFKRSIGLEPEDIVVLQPTRLVQRKGIEHAIHLVRAIGRENAKLVISHQAGDEGYEYAEWLTELAKSQKVDLRLVTIQLSDPWQSHQKMREPYSLWDIYACADFITYPSTCEGFGNAFLEAIFFKKPLLVNRYHAFIKDIEPLGFDLITMDGYLSADAVRQVRDLLKASRRRRQMVEHNFEIARRHFSYNTLRRQLNRMMADLFEDKFPTLQEPNHANLIHLHPDSSEYASQEFEKAHLRRSN